MMVHGPGDFQEQVMVRARGGNGEEVVRGRGGLFEQKMRVGRPHRFLQQRVMFGSHDGTEKQMVV